MEFTVQIPQAFSVREENEFYAFEHLMMRLNPQLRVKRVATGRHINGGCTVLWGVVCPAGQDVPRDELEAALKEAGFDFPQNGPLPKTAAITV